MIENRPLSCLQVVASSRTRHGGLVGIAVGSSGDGVLEEAEKHFDRPVPGPLTFRHSGGMTEGRSAGQRCPLPKWRRFGRTWDASEDRVAGLPESMLLTGDRPASFTGAPYWGWLANYH